MNRSVDCEQVFSVLNCAFYRFVELAGLPEMKATLKKVCLDLDLKGTILLSPEGINGSLAGSVSNVREFQGLLEQNPLFSGIEYKESYSSFVPFQSLYVKVKKEIIPLGDSSIRPQASPTQRLSPQQLKLWLDEGRDFDLVDTRNDYEVEYGTFRGAVQLDLKHFRHYPNKISALPEEQKRRPMVMFCTGGIRCEKAALVAQRFGFEDVYQLEGGILKYFEQCGGDHFEGSCFVFDERVALDSQLKAVSGDGLVTKQSSTPRESEK